jgi:hypothetical protein
MVDDGIIANGDVENDSLTMLLVKWLYLTHKLVPICSTSDMMDVVITARLRQGLLTGFPGGVGTYLFCQICWHFTDRFVL